MLFKEILDQYQNLIFKIDSLCQKLETLYREHLVCRPGCSQCCEVERMVVPIEAYIIEQHLLTMAHQKIKRLRKLHKDDDKTCPFLLMNRCVIYSVRPIICRTVGLPILYHEAERAFIDYCRLNFTKLPPKYEFEEKNILDMNPFHTELIQLDKRFVEHISNQPWRPTNRRSVMNILFNLDLKQK